MPHSRPERAYKSHPRTGSDDSQTYIVVVPEQEFEVRLLLYPSVLTEMKEQYRILPATHLCDRDKDLVSDALVDGPGSAFGHVAHLLHPYKHTA